MTEIQTSLAERIVDTAIQLAERTSWEKLSLHEIGEALDISLEAIHGEFRVKDDLVEAWFDRADRAMLRAADESEFSSLTYRERLHTLIMAWLDFLATHRTVSRDMLLYKLEPAHVHLQIGGLLRVSRTVQWFREAARMEATHVQRVLEEVGLSVIFLNTFAYWLFDSSDRQTRTREFLDRQLVRAERWAAIFTDEEALITETAPGTADSTPRE